MPAGRLNRLNDFFANASTRIEKTVLDYVNIKKPYVESYLEDKAEKVLNKAEKVLEYIREKKNSGNKKNTDAEKETSKNRTLENKISADKASEKKASDNKTAVNKDEKKIVFMNPAVTVSELLDAYKSLGLAGEENNAILQTIAAAHGISFGIEGKSGSGKSHAVNCLMQLLPKDMVYTMELSSKTAEIYNYEEINEKRIIYIPELQKGIKGNPLVLELIKNLTEGRDAIRRVKSGNKTIEQRIIGDKTIIYTLATENQTKKDSELQRRFFTLLTDPSEEQTQKIMEYLALGQYKTKTNKEKALLKKARKHIENCMNLETEFVNPFSGYIVRKLPKTFDMRSKTKHYFELMNAYARFNFQSRYISKHADGNKLFLSIDDVLNINKLCENYFFNNQLQCFNYSDCFNSAVSAMEKRPESADDFWPWLRSQINDEYDEHNEHVIQINDFVEGKKIDLFRLDSKNIKNVENIKKRTEPKKLSIKNGCAWYSIV